MIYSSVVISSGHGLYVRGACGILDEVDEARRVANRVSEYLMSMGVKVKVFHDDVSKTQNENLNRIVDYHNAQVRDLDISVHFNAYEQVSKPMGTEVLYVTQPQLATQLSEAIASVGFTNRGAKQRTDLFFLNNTSAPSVLLEVCFVDSETDAFVYDDNFERICARIAELLSGEGLAPPAPPTMDAYFYAVGPCSYFGGPYDTGVAADEGLAFYDDFMQAPQLFLPYQPEGTSGLARRLNPYVHYVACRWDYETTPREVLRTEVALVRSLEHGTSLMAFPADWGPHESTGRIADLSPGLMRDLGLDTDDEVEVIFPYKEDEHE
jgi:N-acetylmuramoyl-L-alanine amidase